MWNTIAKLIGLFLLITILHWAFLALLGGWGLRVDIMLVFMAAVCACLGPAYGYPTAFICGLFLDFFGVKLFGHNAFIFTGCAMAVYGLEKRLDLDSAVVQMVFVLALCLVAAMGNGLLLKIFAGFSAWNGWSAFVCSITLSVLAAPLIFWIVRYTFPAKRKKY